MHEESSHGSRSRERIAENVYRRRTKRGEVVYEALVPRPDGRQRRRRLEATSERAASARRERCSRSATPASVSSLTT